MRERRPGVWEVRVIVDNDPTTGMRKQRSFTVYDTATVLERRRELVVQFDVDRSSLYCRAAGWTVAELLERFLATEHALVPGDRRHALRTRRWLAGGWVSRLARPGSQCSRRSWLTPASLRGDSPERRSTLSGPGGPS